MNTRARFLKMIFNPGSSSAAPRLSFNHRFWLAWLLSLSLIFQPAVFPVARAAGSNYPPAGSQPLIPPSFAQSNADLAVTALNTSGVVTDSQKLTLTGELGVTLRNLGNSPVNTPFRVIAFEDRNANARFDAGTDVLLGSTDFQGGVAANANANLSLNLSGTVTFKGNLIYVLADSDNAVAETDETNNIQSTSHLVERVPINTLFNTGVDTSRSVLPLGSVDPHYALTTSADAMFPGPNAFTVGSGEWFPNTAASSWISANAGASSANGNYAYTTTFDLSGLDPTTVVINGRWSTDNNGLDIKINGISTGFTTPFEGFDRWHEFTISSGFLPRQNTLEFSYFEGGVIHGLRVEMSGTAMPLSADLIPSFIRKNDNLFPASVELTARVGNGGSATAEGQAVGPNLIQNGSFEGASIDPANGFLLVRPGETSITNWRVTKGDVHYMGTFWEQDDGDRSIDLDGGLAGGLEQNITTVPGNTYQVRFALAGNPAAGPTIKPMRVSAAGQSEVFNFDITGKTFSNMGWEKRTWTFTANSSTTSLRFESLTDTVSFTGFGPALDSVEVRQVLSSGGRFSVAFYRGDPAAGGALIGAAQSTKALAPGEFEDVKVTWNNPPAGLHQIFVVADDDGTGRGSINEGNEANNKAFANFLLGAVQQVLVDDLIARFKDSIVDLKWTPIPGAASYNIYRRTGNQAAQLIKSGHRTSFASFPDSGLTNGTTYYYTVRWVDAGGKESGDGTEISATPTSVANRNSGDVPPTILSAPVTRTRANQPYSYQARASDPDPNETLTWSLPAPPNGMTMNAGTGQIQWTSTSAQAGYVSVQARVVDSRGRFATQTYRLFVETVSQTNQAPMVVAGPDQTITLPASATLNGQATDDGLPDGGTLTISWSKVSGPGTVAFANASSPVTMAAFSAGGTYVLRLTATDGQLSSSDDVTITAIAQNQAPVVNAGPDQTVTLPANSVTLNGTVTDDGLPAGGALTITWSRVSGPGTVTFGAPNAAVTTATFSQAGAYVLRLTASDSQLMGSDEVTITVTPPPNQAPMVNAGPDQTITLPTNSVTLNGTVTDDGLPVGGALSITWSRVSGPGTVTFSNPNSATTTASFSAAGVYVLRLTANDTQLTGSDEVTITVNQQNQAPVVNAGPDRTITLPTNSVTLNGMVTDDGLPAGGPLTIAWSRVSGPGTVTFSPPNAAVTTAAFSAAGVYVLRLTASDTQLTGSDDVTITVNQQNLAPVVNAGPDQTITLPTNSVTLNGTVTDDGLPVGGALSIAWSRVSGPGTVTFSAPNAAVTTATFSAAGVYVLRLTASDSQLSSSDDVTITVNQQNRAPVVNAGPDQTITLPANSVTLNGTVTDDGLPAGGALTITWSLVSGPAAVTFSPPNAAVTTAAFTLVGTYVLRLTASDSQLSASDDVTITVRTTTPPPTVAPTAPADGADITTRTDVRGSVSFNNQPGGSWKLEYSPFTADSSFVLTWTTFATGTGAVNNGVLGVFDPTLLLNGIYVIRLTATDVVGQSAAVMTTVVVSGQQKVGHFTLSFNDLSVPLPGLPIQVIRTYDSRDKRVGDFGVGWTLSLRDVRVQKTDTIGLHWRATTTGGGFPTYCLEPTRPLIVTVTFPDNRVYKFRATTVPDCRQFVPIQEGRLGFTLLPGMTGTAGARLEVVGNNAFLVNGAVGGAVTLIDVNTLTLIDPTQFRLTTAEGFVYVIDQKLGAQSVAEPNGNTITINANGITHSNGQSVAFVRDAQGRITQITDPAGNPLKYGYDANGDLVSFTDRENNITTFTYNSNHYLLTINDPLGRTPIRNEYDANGRLIKHTDAFGKTITYTHDLNTRQEIITDRNGAVRVLEYDTQGNVVKETDPNGKVLRRSFDTRSNRTCETDPHEPGQIAATCEASPRRTLYTYDAQDNLLSVADPLGNKTEYTYNSRRQVLTAKDARGKTTTNVYDSKGNLTSTTDAGGNVTTYTYDAQGNVKSQTVKVDGVDQVTSYDYDARGNLTKETDALGNETTYTYDANGNRLTQTAKRTTGGATETLTTTYTYDKLSRLTQTTDPDGTITRTVYDELSRQKETFDKLDRKTSYSYDEMGRLTRTTYPDTTFEESTYDAEGRRLTSKDRGGRTSTYEYDGLGRLTKTTYPDTTFTRNVYDAAGRLVQTIDARGKTTSYEYDSAGRRTKVRDPLSNETVFTYDANGNQASVKDPKSNTTAFEYDDLNRRVKTIFPDATFTLTSYDSLGRRRGETDQASVKTSFEYDKLGRLTKVIDALSKETTYSYDELGNRLTQTDANNHTTSFEYDKLGRQTKRILPGGASEVMAYDTAGNLKTKTDFIDRATNYDYDLNNRLTMRKYPDTTAVTFTYTATGRRATAVDARGTTSYGYDSRDRLQSLSYPDGRRLEYGYDGNGNRTSLTARIGANVLPTNYSYDDASRLDLVTDPLNRAYDHGYDANGNRASLAYPNGTSTSYSYNTLNRLTNLATTHPASGRTIQSYAFTLGAAGNRTKITEQDGTVRDYSYDALYRLTNEKVTVSGVVSYEKAFTYDNAGNRQRQTTTGQGAGIINYTYDDRDRLLTENATTYGYDNNGNLTSKSGEATYAWDFDNRLIRVETGPTGSRTITEHAYDADGNRVQTKVTPPTGPLAVTNFLVDTSGSLSHVVAETDGAGILRAYYVRSNDLLAVMRPNGAGGFTSRFYHADGIGSIRRLTDDDGNITDSYNFTAFGELLVHGGTDPQPYAFAGEPLDPNSGFQYHRARWMVPSVGRFISSDDFPGLEWDPQSLHKYLYAQLNPISSTDPSGHFTLVSLGTISGFLTALNTLSLVAIAGQFGYRAGTIANDLLIDEKIELEEAIDEIIDLAGDTGWEIVAYRLVNFEGLKLAASLVRKFPGVLSRLSLGTRANVNGRLAEHYIGNAYGMFRNKGREIAGRIPDFFNGPFNRVIREVKNVSHLTWSRKQYAPQLTAFATEAARTGRKLYIHVRASTQVSNRVIQELNRICGGRPAGTCWEIVRDVPEALRVVP